MIDHHDLTILRFLLGHPYRSLEEVERHCGLTHDEAWDRLKRLRRDRLATSSEGWWRLTAEGMTRAGERLGEVA